MISQNKLHEEKDRLKKLCQKEVDQLLKKKQKPFAKKRKPNEDLELNVPIVTSIEGFVRKKVQHLTFDYDGEETFFPGVVVCQKPNSDTELVIRYDCEYRLYSFNFSNFQNSIVKLLPVTHADFIGKRIRQRFTHDEKNDIWWEQGFVIYKDLNNSSDFIVNFFDNEDYDEIKFSLNLYEVLALPLLDDYLNHDVEFL